MLDLNLSRKLSRARVRLVPVLATIIYAVSNAAAQNAINFVDSAQIPAAHYSPKVFPNTLDSGSLPTHPRLFIKDSQLALVRATIEQSPELINWYRRLEDSAEKLLTTPTIHQVVDSEVNLEEIRRSMNLMVTLAGLYRLDGDTKKLDRARKELLAAIAIEVWDTDFFLETAELSLGVSIGYDWLYNSLSPEDRKVISRALIEKALKPGQRRFVTNFKWVKITTNWNPVCNGGLGVTALAVAEEVPTLSAEILDRAVDSIKISMAKYAPDGGDPEGPMYWDYGTTYTVYLIDGLMTTFGSDWGLKAAPGFSQTGRYGMAMIDPLGLRANSSDAEEGSGPVSQMFWFAREFRERAYYERELETGSHHHPSIFHLFWAINQPAPQPSVIDPNQFFKAINVATFRDNWTDHAASYAAFKGGSNLANHAHLDLGSFIIDAKGERWAIDLGHDDYDLPGYNGRDPRRWTYFRISTVSHNTLILDSENQNLRAEAPIIKFHSSSEFSFAVMDLSSTYPQKASSIQRGIRKVGTNFLIQDELELKKPTNVIWNFLTKAEVINTKTGVQLIQGKAQIRLNILEPVGAKFEIESAERNPPEEKNQGVHMIQIKLPEAVGRTRIVVAVESTEFRQADLRITPLGTW